MTCSPCLKGMHSACDGPKRCGCSHDNRGAVVEATPAVIPLEDVEEEENWRKASGRSGNGRRRGKRDAALKDQQSTGRKRAARLYPLDRDAHCEWRGFANCGGGITPILGCTIGFQTDRHHGPDKAVTNNEDGNVHRICSWCHHEWHAKNNDSYDWTNTLFKQHRPRPMTEEELFDAIIRDQLRKERKVKKLRD